MRKIQKSKITIITVVKNGMPYIEDSINSFNLQNYKNKELIIVYSKSTDGTEQFLNKNKNKIDKVIFDKKSLNKYGSINLGIKNATGNIIGVLHADDFFTNQNILTKIANAHEEKKNIDITYGNVLFCKRNNINKIARYWKSTKYQKNLINLGWMPPHTTLFIKKKIYEKLNYSSKYDISADYEFIIKLFSKKINIKYLDLNIVVMRLGGISTSIKTLLNKTYQDIQVLKSFNKNYFKVIPYKILSKVNQLFIGKTKFLNLRTAKGDKLKIYPKIIKKLQIKKSGYILSGLNLAFIGFIENIEPDRSFRLWPDGIFSKFFTKKSEKFAGRNIINKVNDWCTKDIVLVGNLNKHAKIFFKKKKIRIKNYVKLPYGSINLIKKKIIKFPFRRVKQEVPIIITLPTPKQEIVAKAIYHQNPKLKILCLGGALNIVSGHELPVPKFLEDLGLEFFWRLKTDPLRRVRRLFVSFFRAIIFMIFYRTEYEFTEK